MFRKGALGLLLEGVQLPFAYYQGITLERRYGLSTHTRAHWWLDRAKGTALTLVFGAAAALIVWSLLWWTPDYWWAIAAVAFGAIAVVLAQAAPVWLMPIFYHFTPLNRPELASRLIALARRGRPGLVYHVGTGRSHTVRDGLDRLLERIGSRVRVESDPELVSRTGPRDSRADIRRIIADTGWSPEISWEQSLDDLWAEACRQAARNLAPSAGPTSGRPERDCGFSPCA